MMKRRGKTANDKMAENITIGSVPYLNARPLVRWFATEEGRKSGVTVVEAPPSQLAKMLERSEIAVALVSSFVSFQHPEYQYVPGVSISGQDEIRSVRAFARTPFSGIQTCAMDTSSLTSVALLSILLAEVHHVYPQRIALPPDLPSMLAAADAALLIGDPGMLADGSGLQVMDLGEAWRRHTTLPFVYALWLGKPACVDNRIIDALQTAKAYGLTQFDQLSYEESVRLNCPQELCYSYLQDIMDYELDHGELAGLETFRSKSQSLGLLF
jgi:chorismate dehydratase